MFNYWRAYTWKRNLEMRVKCSLTSFVSRSRLSLHARFALIEKHHESINNISLPDDWYPECDAKKSLKTRIWIHNSIYVVFYVPLIWALFDRRCGMIIGRESSFLRGTWCKFLIEHVQLGLLIRHMSADEFTVQWFFSGKLSTLKIDVAVLRSRLSRDE